MRQSIHGVPARTAQRIIGDHSLPRPAAIAAFPPLMARARSAMFADQPGVKADMATATSVVATVVRRIRDGEVMELFEMNETNWTACRQEIKARPPLAGRAFS